MTLIIHLDQQNVPFQLQLFCGQIAQLLQQLVLRRERGKLLPLPPPHLLQSSGAEQKMELVIQFLLMKFTTIFHQMGLLLLLVYIVEKNQLRLQIQIQQFSLRRKTEENI